MIDHLRIVSDAEGVEGIVEGIDHVGTTWQQHHLTHGDTVQGHDVQRSRIRGTASPSLPAVIPDIAIDRLLSDGVTTEYLNDDVLGRILDVITAYGQTEFFNEIIAELPRQRLRTHCLSRQHHHFQRQAGEYDAEFDFHDMTLNYGHPKDNY